eukprot:CAMPEP_0179924024 /NCGR_PEP_ID=MMETSP0983-20121128/6493_1 /TAXON_ID=483367 /ORGANISM="non described non described, Strain CCMP 2436" /LENGTH=514 /DNA_ID=CAMNT_0021827493 /DNA_START=21 /DNA_END=1567 /DNA_ORIENTATION=+
MAWGEGNAFLQSLARPRGTTTHAFSMSAAFKSSEAIDCKFFISKKEQQRADAAQEADPSLRAPGSLQHLFEEVSSYSVIRVTGSLRHLFEEVSSYSVIRVTGLISSETVTELSSMLKLEDKALRQSRSNKLVYTICGPMTLCVRIATCLEAMGKLATQKFSITYAQHGLSYDAFIAETQTEEELSVRQRSVVIEYIGGLTNFSLGESLEKLNLSRLFPDLVFKSARCTGSHATFTGYEATSEEATTDDPYAEEISLPISFEIHIINNRCPSLSKPLPERLHTARDLLENRLRHRVHQHQLPAHPPLAPQRLHPSEQHSTCEFFPTSPNQNKIKSRINLIPPPSTGCAGVLLSPQQATRCRTDPPSSSSLATSAAFQRYKRQSSAFVNATPSPTHNHSDPAAWQVVGNLNPRAANPKPSASTIPCANPAPFGAALSNIINEPTDLAGAPAITPATDNAPVADGSAEKRRRTGASSEETLTGEGATNTGERLQDEGDASPGTTKAHDYNQVPMVQD